MTMTAVTIVKSSIALSDIGHGQKTCFMMGRFGIIIVVLSVSLVALYLRSSSKNVGTASSSTTSHLFRSNYEAGSNQLAVTSMVESRQDRRLHVASSYTVYSSGFQLQINQSDYIFNRECWDCSPIVVPEHKLIFFATPKVGCTVFKQLFRRIRGHRDWALQKFPSIPHDPQRNGLNYLYHFRPEDVREMLMSPTWTKAIFVRDPKERLLSAFLDKGLRSKGGHVRTKCCTGKFEGHEMCRTERITSFEGFIDIVETCSDVHWAPQADRMEDKYWPYINFVGNMDNIAADTKALLQQVRAWDSYGASGWGSRHNEAIFESISLRNHATSARQKMKQYYTPKLEARVEQLYDMDYLHPVMNLRLKRVFQDP